MLMTEFRLSLTSVATNCTSISKHHFTKTKQIINNKDAAPHDELSYLPAFGSLFRQVNQLKG
ncbi:hypothetical protein D918_04076 [Trichuris suis]|nr:hypothetical protein D918_04076 [Trichuris suis]